MREGVEVVSGKPGGSVAHVAHARGGGGDRMMRPNQMD